MQPKPSRQLFFSNKGHWPCTWSSHGRTCAVRAGSVCWGALKGLSGSQIFRSYWSACFEQRGCRENVTTLAWEMYLRRRYLNTTLHVLPYFPSYMLFGAGHSLPPDCSTHLLRSSLRMGSRFGKRSNSFACFGDLWCKHEVIEVCCLLWMDLVDHGQCVQLVGEFSCTPKGCGFKFQPGHTPGLQVWFPVDA